MPKHISRRRFIRNKTIELPDLFSWQRTVAHPPATRAGMHLTRRYRIHPAIADLVASLAGLGCNNEVR